MSINKAKPYNALPFCFVFYASTSFFHFAHNAEYLADYPNMPAWITSAKVLWTWFGETALGLMGFILFFRGYSFVGLNDPKRLRRVGFRRLWSLPARTAFGTYIGYELDHLVGSNHWRFFAEHCNPVDFETIAQHQSIR